MINLYVKKTIQKQNKIWLSNWIHLGTITSNAVQNIQVVYLNLVHKLTSMFVSQTQNVHIHHSFLLMIHKMLIQCFLNIINKDCLMRAMWNLRKVKQINLKNKRMMSMILNKMIMRKIEHSLIVIEILIQILG